MYVYLSFMYEPLNHHDYGSDDGNTLGIKWKSNIWAR